MSDRYCPACNGYGTEPRCPICNQAKQSMFMRDIKAAGDQVTARRGLFSEMGGAAAPAVVRKDKED